MAVHIFLINEENYAISIRRGLAAIPSGTRPDTDDQIISRMSLVKEGDEILFYLIGTKEIRGIFRAYGRPFYDDTPVWPSNNGQIYPYRIRIDNTDMVFGTPVLLSDIFDLRDNGKIWTFSLHRPSGNANSMFSISDAEFKEVRELFLKINPIFGKPAPISEPYRHVESNLLKRLHVDNQGNPKYESGLTAVFFNDLAYGRHKESLGQYSDYLAYVPTSFQKEIDGLLFYSDFESPTKAIAYGLIELKRDIFDEKGLSQLLRYEDWFLKKRAGGDSRAIRTIAIAKRFDDRVIDYVRRRRHLEGKSVRLFQYDCTTGQLELNEYTY
ncbi:MAG: hypothetical protein ABSA86_10230 [Oryzomonas sp.]|jgi:hypothetical protein